MTLKTIGGVAVLAFSALSLPAMTSFAGEPQTAPGHAGAGVQLPQSIADGMNALRESRSLIRVFRGRDWTEAIDAACATMRAKTVYTVSKRSSDWSAETLSAALDEAIARPNMSYIILDNMDVSPTPEITLKLQQLREMGITVMSVIYPAHAAGNQ